MYHIISTIVTATVLYLLSYFFYKTGFYSFQLHKKFWNIILAAAFLVTALAGIFLALQTNYKWNLSFGKTILKWHVEFGIGLAITGMFHFLWNINYFRRLLPEKTIDETVPEYQEVTSGRIKMNLFIIGFVSSAIQFLMLREIMNITGGYELISGSFLGSWLIVSAIGASMAAGSKLNDLRKINLVFAFSPLLSLLLMLLLSGVFFSVGETPSLLGSIIFTFIVLLPFCLVSGFTFIKLVTLAGRDNSIFPGKSFSIETIGGIAAGIVVALLTSGLMNTYKLLLLIVLFSISYVIFFHSFTALSNRIVGGFSAFAVLLVILLLNPDVLFRHILIPGIDVTETRDTPYGNITIGSYMGEESLYYNQRLLAYNDDATEREEDIHYAMLQSELPRKVIMISGSLESHLPEILKYQVTSILYIERDPALARFMPAGGEYPPSLNIINMDAFRYIRNTKDSADVIILLAPPPSTLLLNRFYTSEFFSEIKKNLKPGGVFMCSTGPGDSYYNPEAMNLNSSVFNSLSANFKNVKPVSGNKLYFIASDMDISLSFCSLTEKKDISNIYVCSDYLDDTLILKKSNEVSALINTNAGENSSSYPVACLHSQSYQFSKNIGERIPAFILMFIIFVLPVTAISRKNLIMYVSASALAGFEIILLLTLQLMAGNMYQLTGLVIAGLMAGLAAGSGIDQRILTSLPLPKKILTLLIFYLLFGFIHGYMIKIEGVFLSVAVIILAGFLPALLTGNIFRELTSARNSAGSPSAIYSADLTGSAFGFILISGFTVPVIGIQNSVYLLSGLILAGFLFGTNRN